MTHPPQATDQTFLADHRRWLGFVQPTGLVVTPRALLGAQAIVRELGRARHDELRGGEQGPGWLETAADGSVRCADLLGLLRGWLGLLGYVAEPADDAEAFAALRLPLPELGVTLAPTAIVREPEPDAAAGPAGRAQLLIVEVPGGADLDAQPADDERWSATPQQRLERLLRATGVAAGLLHNGRELRLVVAPRGEASGWLRIRWADLLTTMGRPLAAALELLLGSERLLTAPRQARLPALLAASRAQQNDVTERLSEQVLVALGELLRGVQAADAQRDGALLAGVAPEALYGGLLATVLRVVFLLYAEERELLPQDEVWGEGYSVLGLFCRLRDDAARWPDAMELRYGAWAGLVATFRLLYRGGQWRGRRLPERLGHLFDPDGYPFLEGRSGPGWQTLGVPGMPRLEPPRVSDGVVLQLLEALLMLDGDRLSYRALDVEHIGSVYESMMGFVVETAEHPSRALKPDHVVVDLQALWACQPSQRARELGELAGVKLRPDEAAAVAAAADLAALDAALQRHHSPRSPRRLELGARYLQPTAERRRTGAHYTPRALTEPIVRRTLAPVLAALGPAPTAAQLLALRVCDPAMGSGAFLVEACRQLADALVLAWDAHGDRPEVPPDEEPLLLARRLVASQCVYGVDRNRFAVDLARLSIWLVTTAREHPFTFVDFALWHGDALVGLELEEIAGFRWAVDEGIEGFALLQGVGGAQRAAADEVRRLTALEVDDQHGKRLLDKERRDRTAAAKLAGDAVVCAFFAGSKPAERRQALGRARLAYQRWLDGKGEHIEVTRPVEDAVGEGRMPPALHWGLAFPEVFGRANPGFDAVVGNPPFVGGKRISSIHGASYTDWLKARHDGTEGGADLVAHFYRRAWHALRRGGAFGLVATNTIAQGDTRTTGLMAIRGEGAAIYDATRRLPWPGRAAVIVSVVHAWKAAAGTVKPAALLDGRPVRDEITSFLFDGGPDAEPAALPENAGAAFVGTYVLGMGFTFDDTDSKGVASPLAERERLIAADPRNAERVFPYLGGEELNTDPVQRPHRFVIDFEDMTEEEARRWPALMAIVEERVRPERCGKNRAAHAKYWWRFADSRPGLRRAIAPLARVLATARVSSHHVFAFVEPAQVFSEQLVIFATPEPSALAVLQSRVHQVFAAFLGSTLGDGARYTPSTCFDPFPMPPSWRTDPTLQATGAAYDAHRAALMLAHHEGLTKTYNRFHDPDERSPAILHLRELHAAMDRAVLHAYGWDDLTYALCWVDAHSGLAIDPATATDRRALRWALEPDLRDAVLGRLLAENARRLGVAAAPAPAKAAGAKAKVADSRQGGLL